MIEDPSSSYCPINSETRCATINRGTTTAVSRQDLATASKILVPVFNRVTSIDNSVSKTS